MPHDDVTAGIATRSITRATPLTAPPPASNRLSGINRATGGTRAYTYDAPGNVITDSRGAGYSYTYDAAGRMASMSINGVLQGTYKYDFAGRQAIRTIAATGVTIHSVFDSQGRRIAEYNQATGALIREYVWMGWEPIAVIEGGVTYLVRTDHIGRPAFATNTSGVKVWTASYTPFGGVRTTTGTPINARFPGQWFQSESGLHQNWMRDYDPTTGRYLQADPLGLVDGASVYGYALQSPMMYTDPTGERCVSYTMPDGNTGISCTGGSTFNPSGESSYRNPTENLHPDFGYFDCVDECASVTSLANGSKLGMCLYQWDRRTNNGRKNIPFSSTWQHLS